MTTARSQRAVKCAWLSGKSASTRRSRGPYSATARSPGSARRALRPRSARAGSSDPPCPCGGGASRRTSAGTRDPSGGRPSTGRRNPPSCPRSGGCRSSPGARADGLRATRPGARDAASAVRAAGAARPTSVRRASVRRLPAAGRASRSASAACLRGYRRIWRRETAASFSSQREGACTAAVVRPSFPCWRCGLVLALACCRAGRRRRSGHACEREQQPAGEDRAPQIDEPPGRLQVVGRAGGKTPSGRAPLGAAYAIGVRTVATRTFVLC